MSTTIGGYDFEFADRIDPDRNADGSIREVRPQDKATQPLHRNGNGPFCHFRIDLPPGVQGVYALMIDGKVQYIGEAVDVRKRLNSGYGSIYTRNCEVHGRMTNCRINSQIFHAAERGCQIELYLHRTHERKAVEHELIAQYSPSWNRRGLMQ